LREKVFALKSGLPDLSMIMSISGKPEIEADG